MIEEQESAMEGALFYFRAAVSANKCSHCGCFHSFLQSIDLNFPKHKRPEEFIELVEAARKHVSDIRYDCFGCEVCYPPAILNTLEHGGIIDVVETGPCFTETVEKRDGYPPLPGSYKVLRYHAPVAVCTLTSDDLISGLSHERRTDLAIVGSLHTENIGIERMIQNIIANPNIRFLIVCGEDSRKAVGHLPGQSLIALSKNGLDADGRIIGARGKRPILHNISREAVDHFRRNIDVIDLVATRSVPVIFEKARACAQQHLPAADSFFAERTVRIANGYVPQKMVQDPAGYFVVYVDRAREKLSLEHYRNDGVLDVVIEGDKAQELYCPVIDQGLISRLDHACYLGRELARAEQALLTGEEYTQDGAPEQELSFIAAVSECGANCSCKRSTV